MTYNFGEKKTENFDGKELPVWETPKFHAARRKVIETLESDKYKDYKVNNITYELDEKMKVFYE